MTTKAAETADILWRARVERSALAELPAHLVPTTVEEAYAVQDALMFRLGGHGGWKVGPDNGGGRRCSALPASEFYPSGARLMAPPVGFEVEVETAFTFAHDVVPGILVEDAIGSVRLALEMVGSRFVDRRAVSVFTAVADLQSSSAVILGAEVTDWRNLNLGALRATLSFDGVPQDVAQSHVGMDDTLASLRWLADHARVRGMGLRAGDIVITGARIGPVPTGPATEVEAAVPGLGTVRMKIGVS